jgi:hypothetical protein
LDFCSDDRPITNGRCQMPLSNGYCQMLCNPAIAIRHSHPPAIGL